MAVAVVQAGRVWRAAQTQVAQAVLVLHGTTGQLFNLLAAEVVEPTQEV